MAADGARDRADLGAHAEALVADPVRHREVADAARPGGRRKRADECPSRSAAASPVKLKKPEERLPQCAIGTNAMLMASRNRNTTASIVQAKYSSMRSMVPPKDRISDDEEDEAGGDPGLRGLVGRARHASHPRAEERRRGAAGERRPAELEEADAACRSAAQNFGPGLRRMMPP